MSMMDILAYREDCSRRFKDLYFRVVVLANASKRVMEFEGRFYGPCEKCHTISELSYEKVEDGSEAYLCENCLTHVWGRMQQRMEDDNAREREVS